MSRDDGDVSVFSGSYDVGFQPQNPPIPDLEPEWCEEAHQMYEDEEGYGQRQRNEAVIEEFALEEAVEDEDDDDSELEDDAYVRRHYLEAEREYLDELIEEARFHDMCQSTAKEAHDDAQWIFHQDWPHAVVEPWLGIGNDTFTESFIRLRFDVDRTKWDTNAFGEPRPRVSVDHGNIVASMGAGWQWWLFALYSCPRTNKYKVQLLDYCPWSVDRSEARFCSGGYLIHPWTPCKLGRDFALVYDPDYGEVSFANGVDEVVLVKVTMTAPYFGYDLIANNDGPFERSNSTPCGYSSPLDPRHNYSTCNPEEESLREVGKEARITGMDSSVAAAWYYSDKLQRGKLSKTQWSEMLENPAALYQSSLFRQQEATRKHPGLVPRNMMSMTSYDRPSQSFEQYQSMSLKGRDWEGADVEKRVAEHASWFNGAIYVGTCFEPQPIVEAYDCSIDQWLVDYGVADEGVLSTAAPTILREVITESGRAGLSSHVSPYIHTMVRRFNSDKALRSINRWLRSYASY